MAQSDKPAAVVRGQTVTPGPWMPLWQWQPALDGGYPALTAIAAQDGPPVPPGTLDPASADTQTTNADASAIPSGDVAAAAATLQMPVITAQDETVNANASLQASTLIGSVSDPNGLAITYYDFRDDGGGGGYLSLNGVAQAAGDWFQIPATSLSQLKFIAGSSAASETIDVAAGDGSLSAPNWSYYQTATVTIQSVASDLPVITAKNQSVNANSTILASTLIGSSSDPNGYAITYFDFRDDGGGGGYLSLNGVIQSAGDWITVSANNLSQLQFVGTKAGNETVDVAAWDGYNWSYYQTATVTTLAVTLNLPVVTAKNQTVNANASIAASTLIGSVSDPNGKAITLYNFKDDGGGGGYLTLNGVKQAVNNWITVSAANLPQLLYVGGPNAGNETVDVAVGDGTLSVPDWSYYQTATVTTLAVLPPIVTAQNQQVNANATILGSSLFASVADPNGFAITAYDFRDDGGGGGYLSLNGVKQATNTWITVSAANLAQMLYVGGASAGSETVDIAAYDGSNWSDYQTATIITKPSQNNAPPVLTVANPTVNEYQSIQASTLIASVNDPNKLAITYYGFNDQGGTGGYFIQGGLRQDVNNWIVVSAANLSQLLYTGGSTTGTEKVDVAVWDGQSWSATQVSTITTQVAQVARPVITAQNETVSANASIQASTLIASVSDPAGNAISQYDFRDDGTGGGYLSLNGVKQASGSWINVTAANLPQLKYVGGASAGSESVDVAAWDGTNWSYYQTATVTTKGAAALPVVVAQNQTVNTGASILASTLVASFTDPAGLKVASYQFRDDGGGGGYLSLSGVKQATNTWITVSAANISQLTFVGGATAGTETIDVAASDGTSLSNYATATVTTQGSVVTNPVIALLKDAGVKADATKYIVNNSLSYAGMLAILQDVAKAGVNATSFADLKTLVSYFNKTNGIAVSTYLAYISNSLVNGSPANQFWTGGGKTTVALGNLAANSSQTVLNELIGKWFLGTDLPAPIFDSGAPSTIAYVNDTNPLYGANGLPSINDINQSYYLGDCYLLASLAEVAQNEPSDIQTMLTNNGNGTYGVRFYIGGQPVYVTVNTSLPTNTATGALIGNMSPDLWGSLIEKAYVELNSQPGFLEHTTGNEYLLIENGNADPITQITGRTVTAYNSQSSPYNTATAWANLKNTFVTAIQNGQEVDFASYGDTKINGATAFVSHHMLSGLGYDSATGNFIIRNPWGTEPGQYWLTQFEASMSDLLAVKGTIFVATGNTGATPATASATSSSLPQVTAAYQAILRVAPDPAYASGIAAQIDGGSQSLTLYETSLITGPQAIYSTLPALVTIDAIYGVTSGSAFLDSISAGAGPLSAAYLHNLGYSDANVWSILGSWWADDPGTNFRTTYGSQSTSAAIQQLYQKEFGFAPTSANLQNLVNDVPGLQALLKSDAVGVLGGIYGYLLYVGQTNNIGQLAAPADAFLQAAANGTVTYGPELNQEFATPAVSANASALGDPVTISASNAVTDPGAGDHAIQFLAGTSGDTIVLHTSGTASITGFDLAAGDVLDVSGVFAEAGIKAPDFMANLGTWLTVVDQGTNAVLLFEPPGQGIGTPVAVLSNMSTTVTGLASLTNHNAIVS